MSKEEEVRTVLIGMGIEPRLAHEASTRYQTAEAALNWVFGEGENWKPEEPQSLNPFRNKTEPAERPRSLPAPPQHWTANFPAPPSSPAPGVPASAVDEEDELMRALELSKQSGEAERGVRERSVRASAPPPSPRNIAEDEIVAFGPSNKDDPEGNLAVTILPPDQANTTAANKEEEDMRRAIEQSMMAASFHSISNQQENLPPPQPKEPGAPVVLLATEQPIYAANFLQALAAVPQLRDIFTHIEVEQDGHLSVLKDLFTRAATEKDNYILIDEQLQAIHSQWDTNVINQPPSGPLTETWIPNLSDLLKQAATSRSDLVLLDDTLADFYRNYDQLFATKLQSDPQQGHSSVAFDRLLSCPTNIHDALANAIWTPDNPGESIKQIADVVFVHLRRTPGVLASKWEFDQEVVLDRYLTSNAAWAAQIRARQGVMGGELRRLNQQVETLSSMKGHSVADALKTLIKHLETSSSSDEVQSSARLELKFKLEHVAAAIAGKIASLQEQVAANGPEAAQAMFNTEDPLRNQHRYLLRAILWHDGFMTPGKHLYAYVRGEDGWWRVQDDATRVDWESIQNDNTGQFTDGGPYILVYSRDGPRPDAPADESPETVPTTSGMDLMDVEMGGEPDPEITPFPPNEPDPEITPFPVDPEITPFPVDVRPERSLSPRKSPAITRSRPHSPIKGAVRGPRPLPRRSSVVSTDGSVGTPQPAAEAPAKPNPDDGMAVDKEVNLVDLDDDIVMK